MKTFEQPRRPFDPVIPAPIHGDRDADELRALGVDPEKVVDFSVCINPYGLSPRVREALARATVDRYPDRKATELRRALSHWLHLGSERILVGNGSSELIWLVSLALLRPGDRVLIPEPTYGEYARSAAIAKARVISLPLRENEGFLPGHDAMVVELTRNRPGSSSFAIRTIRPGA